MYWSLTIGKQCGLTIPDLECVCIRWVGLRNEEIIGTKRLGSIEGLYIVRESTIGYSWVTRWVGESATQILFQEDSRGWRR